MERKSAVIPMIILLGICVLSMVYPSVIPAAQPGTVNSGDTAWMLCATGLVLLMTPGLSFFYGGMVNDKNVVSTMLQSFIAMGLISVLWVVVGFSLAFGQTMGGVVGNPMTFFMFNNVGGAVDPNLSPTIPLALFALFQLKFAIITPALITGSFAERVRFSSYCLFICLFSIFIYAPLAHMTWHPDGLLRKWGVLDFAGGTVVHMAAGFAALAGAYALGARKKTETVPHNIPYIILGTGLLWFGWFGFNAGSALSAGEGAVGAFLATNTASASAMLAWVLIDVLRGKQPSAVGACIAAVVGLVAITPASGFVSVGSSIVIGVLAAAGCNFACSLRAKSNLDDTLDVFPCHGIGGIIGMIGTGIFAINGGLINGDAKLFVTHLLALAIVAAFTFCGSFLLYKIADMIIPLRVKEEEERLGLDLSQHGEAAIPVYMKNANVEVPAHSHMQ